MLVVILVYQQVENYLIQPAVMRQAVELSGFATIAVVMLGGALLGVVGAVLAVPVAASVKIVLRELTQGRRSADGRAQRSARPAVILDAVPPCPRGGVPPLHPSAGSIAAASARREGVRYEPPVTRLRPGRHRRARRLWRVQGGKAQDAVWDARADVQKQVDELKDTTVTTRDAGRRPGEPQRDRRRPAEDDQGAGRPHGRPPGPSSLEGGQRVPGRDRRGRPHAGHERLAQ